MVALAAHERDGIFFFFFFGEFCNFFLWIFCIFLSFSSIMLSFAIVALVVLMSGFKREIFLYNIKLVVIR